MSNTVINTNILALNSHRSLKTTGQKQAVSSARLSSGLKINSAADDAAGLSISEKMRAQIRGLDMASKNSQDAISLIQTAEGGMQEIDNMLQRIRELVNQSANDTNEHNDDGTGDRQKIQDEINQLVEEIDSMSDRVEFNKKKLLDGSYSAKGTGSSGADGAFYNNMNIDSALKDLFSNGTALAVIDWGDTAGIESIVTGWSSSGDVLGGYADLKDALKDNDSVAAKTALDKITDALDGLANCIIDDAVTATTTTGEFSDITWKQIEDLSTLTGLDAIFGDEDDFDAIMDFYNGAAELSDRLDTITKAESGTGLDKLADAKKIFAEGTQYSALMDIFKGDNATLVANSKYVNPLTDKEVEKLEKALSELGRLNFDADYISNLTESDISKALDNLNYVLGAMDKVENAAIKAGETTSVFADGTSISITSLKTFTNKLESYKEAKFGGVGGSSSSGSSGGNALHFQVGSNANQSMYLNIGKIKSDILGIGNGMGKASINVLEDTGADITGHLDTLDDALSYVTTERSKLGAAQNRLEYTIKSLDISSENLSAAESRIRDTDMAKEMMQVTQANVLQQAATSMLAQANQAPQNILQLLR